MSQAEPSNGREAGGYISVVGYGRVVGPAFGGALAAKTHVPISEVAESPARIKTDIGVSGSEILEYICIENNQYGLAGGITNPE